MGLTKSLTVTSLVFLALAPTAVIAANPNTEMCVVGVGHDFSYQMVIPGNVQTELDKGGFLYAGPSSGNKNEWCNDNAPEVTPTPTVTPAPAAPSVPEFGLIPGILAGLGSVGGFLALRRRGK